jgi:hypothetical protein
MKANLSLKSLNICKRGEKAKQARREITIIIFVEGAGTNMDLRMIYTLHPWYNTLKT